MNVAGISGIGAAASLLLVTIALGGPPEHFANIPSAIVVIGVVLGLQLMMHGARGLGDNLRAFRVFVVNVSPASLDREAPANLRSMVVHLYAAGVIGMTIGLVQMLSNMDDPSQVAPALAVSMLTVFYAAVLSECLVRPCANRVEYLLGQQPDGPGVEETPGESSRADVTGG